MSTSVPTYLNTSHVLIHPTIYRPFLPRQMHNALYSQAFHIFYQPNVFPIQTSIYCPVFFVVTGKISIDAR